MSWFRRKPRPGDPAPVPAQVAVRANPVAINPDVPAQRAFAEWRIAHIDRWFADPENEFAPITKIEHLASEKRQLKAALGLAD